MLISEPLANHEKDDWINGQKTEDIVAFLDRLYTAKRKAEARIAILGGHDDSVRSSRHSKLLTTSQGHRHSISSPQSLQLYHA